MISDRGVSGSSAASGEASAASSGSALSGPEVGRLRDAIVTAFDEDSLEVFLMEKLSRDLAHVTSSKGDFPYRVFKLIRRADQEGWVTALVDEAARARPGNASLQDLADETAVSGVDEDWAGLERVVIPASGFQDVGAWRGRLAELEERVCRIEYPVANGSALGTGLLVAPDLVLTNFHVIAFPGERAGALGNAQVIFGHKLAVDRTVVASEPGYRLAGNAVVAAQRPSNIDFLRNPGGRLPAAGELDFALLRLASPAGHAPVAGSSRERGWERLAPPDSAVLEPNSPLLILQYPEGEPLKLSIGQSLGLNGNETRLRHTVSTRRGSSGSPCLSAKLEVVAIHHAGDPNFDAGHQAEYNSGIPVSAILQYLAGTEVACELADAQD